MLYSESASVRPGGGGVGAARQGEAVAAGRPVGSAPTGRASQKLVLTDRAQLQLDGVAQVVNFDDEIIVIETAVGLLTVEGRELHITKLIPETGELWAQGKIDGLYYSDTKKSKGRLFRR